MFDQYTDDFLAGPEGVIVRRIDMKRENGELFILFGTIEDDNSYALVVCKLIQGSALKVVHSAEFRKYYEMTTEYGKFHNSAIQQGFQLCNKWESVYTPYFTGSTLNRAAMNYLIEEYPVGSLVHREGEAGTRPILKYSHRGAHIESLDGSYLTIVPWSDFLKYKKTKRQPERGEENHDETIQAPFRKVDGTWA